MSFNNLFKATTPNKFSVSKAAGTAVVKGRLYSLSGSDVALVTGAVSGGNMFLAEQDIAIADEKTVAQVSSIHPTDIYIVDTVNASNVAHNGQIMLANATGDKLINTGTTAPTGSFIQVGVVAGQTNQIRAVRVI